MEKPFKKEQTNQLFYVWLRNSPESYHPYDMERFYDFIYNLLESREELSEEILTNSVKAEKSWTPEFVTEFVNSFFDRYLEIREFWGFLKEKKKI